MSIGNLTSEMTDWDNIPDDPHCGFAAKKDYYDFLDDITIEYFVRSLLYFRNWIGNPSNGNEVYKKWIDFLIKPRTYTNRVIGMDCQKNIILLNYFGEKAFSKEWEKQVSDQ